VPDIFISHKVEERPVAARLAKRLIEAGYSVWWDASLLAGDRFETEITARLDEARVVIVLWSRLAAQSDWVRAEAETARKRGIALPVLIDDVPVDALPMLFRHLHMVSLKGWRGTQNHQGYQDLLASIAERIGAAPAQLAAASQLTIQTTDDPNEDELWQEITENPDQNAEEYRNYLARYGGEARFADLARMRIRRIEQTEHRERGGLRVRWTLIVGLGTLIGSLVAGAQWLQDNPLALRWLQSAFVSDEVKRASATCDEWFLSGNIDTRTGIPIFDAAQAKACERAGSDPSDSPDDRARLALLRLQQGDPSTASDTLKTATQAEADGSAIGSFVLGMMHESGLSPLKYDIDLAVEKFAAAAAKGVLPAIGRLCADTLDVSAKLPPGTPDTPALCADAARRGSAVGQHRLGLLYEYGEAGITYDPVKAVELYRQAAAQGNSTGQYLLASMLQRGEGVAQDLAEARHLLDLSTATGNPIAIRQLGMTMEAGLGTKPDYAAAGRLYEEAANTGDNIALYLLARSIQGASQTPWRFTERLELDRLSKEATPEIAERLLGYRKEFGIEAVTDKKAAEEHYRKAAAAGNPFALLSLALLVRDKSPPELDESFALLKSAAASSEMHVQYLLAVAYDTGLGTFPNPESADALFKASADQGYAPARSELLRLASP
jgi:TPR repeat protein